MSLQINYKNSYLKNKIDNLVIFVDESFNMLHVKKHILKNEYVFINDLIKVSDKKSKIISYDLSSKKKIILVSIKKNLNNSAFESLGAKFYDQIKVMKQNNFIIDTSTIKNSPKNFMGYFLHGIKLKSYNFEKYKSKKNKKKIKQKKTSDLPEKQELLYLV